MTGNCRIFCLTIMLLAFTVRCLIPAGFMPSQEDVFTLVICTPTGIETITVDENNNPVDNPHTVPAMPECPFAPVLAFGMMPDAPQLAVSQLAYQPVSYLSVLPLPVASLPAVYAAQAPPAIFSI